MRQDDIVTLRRRAVALNLCWPQEDSKFRYSLLDVPIQRFGTFVYPLESTNGQAASKITLYVSLEHGSKVVRVLSPVQIRNSTAHPHTVLLTRFVLLLRSSLVLFLTTNETKYLAREKKIARNSPDSPSQSHAIGPLGPGEAAPIPVDFLTWSFCYRPIITPISISALRERGPNLDLEAAKATSNAADALGYTWSPSV